MSPQKNDSFLSAILESFVDGVLILTEQGEVIYSNVLARRFCQQLSSQQTLPSQVWQVCQYLIDSQELYPDRSVVLESEINQSPTLALRIRVKWLKLETMAHPCLLVELEDQRQSFQSLALAEAQKFGLTPREAEVWLLRRCHLSRKEIAAELYITLHTVQKHLKNIAAKRKAVLEEDGWSGSRWAS